ncbi:MAG: YIP1 family protein [Deltaproteobacteria bacterium]|nr:YIP1 family protein [Deltaproteobacteria bacterium]
MTVDIVCPHCSFSKSVPEDKIPLGAKTAICPRCRQRFEIPDLENLRRIRAGGDQRRTAPAWEMRSELGIGKSILESLKGVLFSPSRFFRKTAVNGGIKEPLAFGIMMGSLGMMFEISWQGVMRFRDLPSLSQEYFGDFRFGFLIMGIVLLCPVISTIFICTAGLVLHFLLTLLRAGKSGFEATLRAVCYSQATQIWAVIPFLGSFLAGIWLMAVTVVSLKEIHNTTYARVILALLIPFVVVVMTIAAGLISFFVTFYEITPRLMLAGF